MSKDTAVLQFWFEFGSTYSYLSALRIERAAANVGVTLIYKPFLLGPIFRSFGWETSPFLLQKEKGSYMWEDMRRQARKYGLPWRKPSNFPRSAILPARIAIFGAAQPWIGAFCREVMLLNFSSDKEINSREEMTHLLSTLGLPAEEILRGAESAENKEELRAQTHQAAQLGIFGAPSFISRGTLFWGNDRLEDAIIHAAHLDPSLHNLG